jgi:hypothetical protein
MQTLSSSRTRKLIASMLVSLMFLFFTSSITRAANAPLDFDGDGKTDYVIARPTSGSLIWYLQRSTAGFQGLQWGATSGGSSPTNDRVVPADYDGDGKWDICVWRPGAQATFYILRSSNNTLQSVPWGATGDNPNLTQDFDGDHKADPTVVREYNGYLYWFIRQSTNNTLRIETYGIAGLDVPVRGNYDGDAKADLAVYRGGYPSPSSTYYVWRSSNNTLQTQQFGNANVDEMVPGDYDGDGKTDFAIFRTTNGVWYWLQSSNGQVRGAQFGTATTDGPVQGDYDGDGKCDIAVRRNTGASAGDFYVYGTRSGFTSLHWGVGTNDLLVGAILQNTINQF